MKDHEKIAKGMQHGSVIFPIMLAFILDTDWAKALSVLDGPFVRAGMSAKEHAGAALFKLRLEFLVGRCKQYLADTESDLASVLKAEDDILEGKADGS